jgi:hypothetical protein
MTSSAVARSEAGTVRPSIRAICASLRHHQDSATAETQSGRLQPKNRKTAVSYIAEVVTASAMAFFLADGT